MDLSTITAGVFLGNLITLCVILGFSQVKKSDYRAPWWAYAAIIFPLLYGMAELYLSSH